MAYTRQGLIQLFGEPERSGRLIGDGSGGFAPTPWVGGPAELRFAPLGRQEYMAWGNLDHEAFAVRPQETKDEWFLVCVPDAMKTQIELTPWETLFPPGDLDAPVCDAEDVKIHIMSKDQFESRAGREYEELCHLYADKFFPLDEIEDERIPGYVFIPLVKRRGKLKQHQERHS